MSCSKMIPLFQVNMSAEAKCLVSEVLDSGICGEGPKVEKFENELRKLWEQPYVVALNSCTSALTLALRLANVKPDSIVLSTPFTMVATNCAIKASGAKICFIDICEHDLCMDLEKAEEVLKNKSVAAVVITLVAGLIPYRFEEFMEICARKHVPIILDCAHAFLTTYKGLHISHWADFCCFSFQSIKHLTTGDGGALTTTNRYHYQRAEKLKWFGMSRDVPVGKTRLEHQMTAPIPEWGYKFHMNDIAAAIGLANLELSVKSVQACRDNATAYREILTDKLIEVHTNTSPSWWTYPVLYSANNKAADLVNQFANHGIVVSPMWPFNSNYSCFDQISCKIPDVLPIFIPNGPWVQEEECQIICNALKEIC